MVFMVMIRFKHTAPEIQITALHIHPVYFEGEVFRRMEPARQTTAVRSSQISCGVFLWLKHAMEHRRTNAGIRSTEFKKDLTKFLERRQLRVRRI